MWCSVSALRLHPSPFPHSHPRVAKELAAAVHTPSWPRHVAQPSLFPVLLAPLCAPAGGQGAHRRGAHAGRAGAAGGGRGRGPHRDCGCALRGRTAWADLAAPAAARSCCCPAQVRLRGPPPLPAPRLRLLLTPPALCPAAALNLHPLPSTTDHVASLGTLPKLLTMPPQHLPASPPRPAPAANVASLDTLLELFAMREGRLLAQLLAAMKPARSGEQASGGGGGGGACRGGRGAWRRRFRLRFQPCRTAPARAPRLDPPAPAPPVAPACCESLPHSPDPCSLPPQVFEIWMKQQSDTVQHTAQSYAEREVRGPRAGRAQRGMRAGAGAGRAEPCGLCCCCCCCCGCRMAAPVSCHRLPRVAPCLPVPSPTAVAGAGGLRAHAARRRPVALPARAAGAGGPPVRCAPPRAGACC